MDLPSTVTSSSCWFVSGSKVNVTSAPSCEKPRLGFTVPPPITCTIRASFCFAYSSGEISAALSHVSASASVV